MSNISSIHGNELPKTALQPENKDLTLDQKSEELNTSHIFSPTSPLAAQEELEDLRECNKNYIELLEECRKAAVEANVDIEVLLNLLFSEYCTLQKENFDIHHAETKKLLKDQFKLSDKRAEKMMELTEKIKSSKTWNRLVNITTGFSVAAAAAGLSGGLGLIAPIILLGNLLDEELGRPIKRSFAGIITGDRNSQVAKQYAGYINLVFQVGAFLSTGTALFVKPTNIPGPDNLSKLGNLLQSVANSTKGLATLGDVIAKRNVDIEQKSVLEIKEEHKQCDEKLNLNSKLMSREITRKFESMKDRFQHMKVNRDLATQLYR